MSALDGIDVLALCFAGTSVNWSAGASASAATLAVHEVTLSGSGRKAGAAKKGPATLKTRSSLCKAVMFSRWLQLSASCSWNEDSAGGECSVTLGSGQLPNGRSRQDMLYCDAKRCAGRGYYAESWSTLKKDARVFERWLQKPAELEGFIQAPWLGT